MKITFLVSTMDNKTHLIQHDTAKCPRPKVGRTREINVGKEWDRCLEYRRDLISRLAPKGDVYEDVIAEAPTLIGAVEGLVSWYHGVDVENGEGI